MSENSINGSKFYLTARAGEQLPRGERNNEEKEAPAVISDYISTTPQTSVASKEQNSAIMSLAMAGFSLGKSSAVSGLNNYNNQLMLKAQLSK